jgi:hypothetical protein
MLRLLLTIASLASGASPGSVEVHLSDCASGGFDYFFFDDGAVIAKCWGCETKPDVQLGRWHHEGDSVVLVMEREWMGVGQGRILQVASVNVYESYAAVTRTDGITTDQVKFDPEDFTSTQDSCQFARPHQRAEDPHTFLRQFEGRYPETFQRVLGPNDLAGKQLPELRLMRNEIFARYGLRFGDPVLRAHFEKQPGYAPKMTSVDAFLSQNEHENVARLAAAEKAAKRSPSP